MLHTLARSKSVYLSGPMTGIRYFNFPRFEEVTEALRLQGNTVFSPAEYDAEHYATGAGVPGYEDGNVPEWSAAVGFDYHTALSNDFAEVMAADAIVMLPGWEASTGARAERFVAESLGKEVYLARFFDTTGWEFVLDDNQSRLGPLLKAAVEADNGTR